MRDHFEPLRLRLRTAFFFSASTCRSISATANTWRIAEYCELHEDHQAREVDIRPRWPEEFVLGSPPQQALSYELDFREAAQYFSLPLRRTPAPMDYLGQVSHPRHLAWRVAMHSLQ